MLTSWVTSRVDDIRNAINGIQRHSYQYNVKIVGLPEIDPRESASTSTSLYISLQKVSGVDINNQDVDIVHHLLARQATAGPRPVICKFIQRIVKEEVINQRKEVRKVSATSIGLPAECSLGNVKVSIISLHRPRSYLPKLRNFKFEMDSGSVGQKTLLSICKSLRSPIQHKSQEDLERFARQEDLPMS